MLVRKSIVKVNLTTKFLVRTSNNSAVRGFADTHTDGTDFIPSTSDARGNNIMDIFLPFGRVFLATIGGKIKQLINYLWT